MSPNTIPSASRVSAARVCCVCEPSAKIAGPVMRRVNTTLALHKTQNSVCPFANTSRRVRSTLDADAMNLPSAFVAAGLLAAFLAPAAAFAQADYAREQRLPDEITPGIVVRDAGWIELKSGRKFVAIYAPIASLPGWRGNREGR